MRVTVVGAGYVGVASALAFAHIGHSVRVYDRDPRRIAQLADKRDPLDEPLVGELLQTTGLEFSTSQRATHQGADVVAISVGTPPTSTGAADLADLLTAAQAIAEQCQPCVVLIRSTVPVGTADRLQSGPLRRFSVVANPEFLREGRAVSDSLSPDRVVAGGDENGEHVTEDLYGPILRQTFQPIAGHEPKSADIPLCWMDRRSAELAKYAANAFLATKLSFVNEIANLASILGADIRAVTRVLSLDPRIGGSFLRPGLGWGGSCFPKDTRALASFALDGGYDLTVLKAAIDQNNRQVHRLFGQIDKACAGQAVPRIGLLGLAFKSGTKDCRESPAVALAQLMTRRGWQVAAYDPAVSERFPELPREVRLVRDKVEAAKDADAVVIATEWPDFSADLKSMRLVMRGDLLFDGRCTVDPDDATAAGFRYRGICAPTMPTDS